MWTPTDHWLEITIETLGRWEGWMAQGALQGEKYLPPLLLEIYNLIVASLFHEYIFFNTLLS